MLAPERRARILAELERQGSVRVRQLVPLLGVSDMTVRRDLDVLQSEGQLFKVHGGATRHAERSTDEPGFGAKSSLRRVEKEAIALRAATLVEPGSAVAISAGTTTYAMARHLADIPRLTVVTNSVRVADLLHAHGRSDWTVLLTGGLRTPSDALVGPLAINALRSLHTDVVFMGTHGMDPSTGFTTPNLMESETNRALVACARCLVVLADSSKWGVAGLSSFAPLSDADVLVTDSQLASEARAELTDHVGELVLAEPAVNAAATG
jgi:DeoR/GlpR family transcriptional regulator of sugar metabolism